jgi:xylulokinase
VSLETTRPDLVRAVLEGVAFNLRWLLGPVEGFVHHRLDEISFAGGAAASDAWAQILADVLDRPVRQLAQPAHANCRAMALLALHRLGHVELERVASPTRAVYEPQPANRETYARLHEQFLAAYEQNQPIFDTLNSQS